MSNISFADGETITRSNCNVYGWKYKARSRVTVSGVPTTDKETKCDIAGFYPDTWTGNTCAHQWAINQWGNESQGGAVTRWYWICARGNSNSDLYYNLVENKIKKDPTGYEQSSVTCAETIFENDKVVKKGINASFTVLGKDLFSSLEIVMWLPNVNLDYDDSIPTTNNTFWQGKIELLNGEVNLSGKFPKDSYKLTQYMTEEGLEYKVEIIDLNIEGYYPQGISNSDLIEVVMRTDAGIHEDKAINDALTLSENKNELNINIYPNPTSDFININLDSDILKMDELLDVTIYDLNGKTLFSTSFLSSEKTFKLNLSKLNLDNGVYFVMVKSNNLSYLEKLVIK